MNEPLSDFVDVARLEEIVPGTGMFVRVADRRLALFNVDGAIHAIDDTCAHMGSSLATGRLQGKFVTCPSHGWRYDVTTGYLATTEGFGVASYPVQIIDGRILVKVK